MGRIVVNRNKRNRVVDARGVRAVTPEAVGAAVERAITRHNDLVRDSVRAILDRPPDRYALLERYYPSVAEERPQPESGADR
jgi:hypothetical protein